MRRAFVFALLIGCGTSNNNSGDGNANGGGDGGGGDMPGQGCPPGGMQKMLLGGLTQASCGPRLAADGTNVYVLGKQSGMSSILAIPKAGGNAATLATSAFPICDFAVDATSVYWTTGIYDEVKRAPLTPGAEQTLTNVQTPDTDFYDLAVDGTSVYWTSRSSALYPIQFAPLIGGAPMKLTTPELLSGFVLVGGNFVGADPGPPADPMACAQGICNYPSGRIISVATTGGTANQLYGNVRNLAPSPTAVRAFITDGSDLYWLQSATVDMNIHRNGDGQVMRAPAAGGAAPVSLGTGFNQPIGLAVDDAHAYFTADMHVWRVAKTGGTLVSIADGTGALAV